MINNKWLINDNSITKFKPSYQHFVWRKFEVLTKLTYKLCRTNEENLESVFSKTKNLYIIHSRSLNLEKTVDRMLQFYYNVIVLGYKN